MSPIADGSEKNEALEGQIYVRVSEEIAFRDSDQTSHAEIASRYFPDQPLEDGKLLVDDKGEISVTGEGKLEFGGRPWGSVVIDGEPRKAREKTAEVARGLYGKERVG